jgi:hypothetical protein
MHLRDPLTGRLRSVRAHPFGFLAMAATLALIPWPLIYITQLPDHHTAKHWNLAWAGFDLALCAALGITAWAALRERALLIVGLIVSSTLLVCDAWFDVATSLDTADETVTLVTAIAVELPLACYFAILAYRYLRTSIRVSRPEYADRALYRVPLARDEREVGALGDKLDAQTSG